MCELEKTIQSQRGRRLVCLTDMDPLFTTQTQLRQRGRKLGKKVAKSRVAQIQQETYPKCQCEKAPDVVLVVIKVTKQFRQLNGYFCVCGGDFTGI